MYMYMYMYMDMDIDIDIDIDVYSSPYSRLGLISYSSHTNIPFHPSISLSCSPPIPAPPLRWPQVITAGGGSNNPTWMQMRQVSRI